MKIIDSKEKAYRIAAAAYEKKAEDIVLLDLKAYFSICDYFLILNGSTARRIKSISDNIQKKLGRYKELPWHREGTPESHWLILDYGDVIVHIFYEETRRFYDLERLWCDAPRERLDERWLMKRYKSKHPMTSKLL